MNHTSQRFFFIGIGGIGMSGLARILHEQGHEVSGCDSQHTPLTEALEKEGIEVTLGTELPEDLTSFTCIVFSSAIPENHPTLLAAADAPDCRVISRGQLLAEIIDSQYSLVVAGCHGKTSTSSLLSHVINSTLGKCSFAVGGIINKYDTNARWHEGAEHVVAESDESDGSFLLLKPDTAIVTNIDMDHLETYDHNFDCLLDAYQGFMQHPYEHGHLIAGIDCPHVRALVAEHFPQAHTYGNIEGATHRIVNYEQSGWHSTLTTRMNGEEHTWYYHGLPGSHFAQNVTGVISACRLLGLDDESIAEGLASFAGISRRFEHLATWNQANLISDYAHHPVEITATLAAAEQLWPDHPLYVVFEPHRYSRTRDHALEFAEALSAAKHGWILPVYAAGEEDDGETSGNTILNYMEDETRERWETTNFETTMEEMIARSHKPCTVMFLGAGGIDKAVRRWLSSDPEGK